LSDRVASLTTKAQGHKAAQNSVGYARFWIFLTRPLAFERQSFVGGAGVQYTEPELKFFSAAKVGLCGATPHAEGVLPLRCRDSTRLPSLAANGKEW
jgi:hypothetical protein